MWAGPVDDIPASWHLCDGDSGTPDLRDKFVQGAGGALTVGAGGGNATLTSTGTIAESGSHSHPVTVGDHALTEAEMPAHKHLDGVGDGGDGCFTRGTGASATSEGKKNKTEGSGPSTEGYTETIGGGLTHTHEGSVTTDSGAHTHDITLDPADNLPPYYALCFIMKIV
jgi:hypothetical protein